MIKKLAITSFIMLSYVNHAYAGKAEHVHGLHHKEASSGGLPQLDPSSFTSQAFWLVLIFVAIYLFFSRKALPDISSVVENRAERIKSDLDSAAILKEEVELLQKSYEDNLESTRKKSVILFKEIEDSIKAKTEKHNEAFQEHSSKKIAKLESAIEKARISTMNDMGDIAADVAVTAAEKIIGVRADAKSVRDVVNSLNKAA